MNISISIHSLHTEGDITTSPKSTTADYFNPLPPHGGRHYDVAKINDGGLFQSTPSTRRETRYTDVCEQRYTFQSTPSTRRETRNPYPDWRSTDISIHSLHTEGDVEKSRKYGGRKISIHSLHTEGDFWKFRKVCSWKNFNPLPPHGGRHRRFRAIRDPTAFQSTPSTRRETAVHL